MSTDFIQWLEEHKEEYGVKIVENPTKDQREQFEKDCQGVLDWIQEMKKFAH